MLTKLVNIIKSYIIPIGGGVSLIGGGILYIYSLGIKAEKDATRNISLEMKVDKLVTSDSLKTIKMDSLYYGQRRILRTVASVGNTVGIVKTQLGNHIIKTSQDKNDILNWVNAFEFGEKKNSMRDFSQTP